MPLTALRRSPPPRRRPPTRRCHGVGRRARGGALPAPPGGNVRAEADGALPLRRGTDPGASLDELVYGGAQPVPGAGGRPGVRFSSRPPSRTRPTTTSSRRASRGRRHPSRRGGGLPREQLALRGRGRGRPRARRRATAAGAATPRPRPRCPMSRSRNRSAATRRARSACERRRSRCERHDRRCPVRTGWSRRGWLVDDRPDGAQPLVRGSDGNDEPGPQFAVGGDEEGIVGAGQPPEDPRPRKLVETASGTFRPTIVDTRTGVRDVLPGRVGKHPRLGVLDGDRRLRRGRRTHRRGRRARRGPRRRRARPTPAARSRTPRSSHTTCAQEAWSASSTRPRPSRCAASTDVAATATRLDDDAPAAHPVGAASSSSIAARRTRPHAEQEVARLAVDPGAGLGEGDVVDLGAGSLDDDPEQAAAKRPDDIREREARGRDGLERGTDGVNLIGGRLVPRQQPGGQILWLRHHG